MHLSKFVAVASMVSQVLASPFPPAAPSKFPTRLEAAKLQQRKFTFPSVRPHDLLFFRWLTLNSAKMIIYCNSFTTINSLPKPVRFAAHILSLQQLPHRQQLQLQQARRQHLPYSQQSQIQFCKFSSLAMENERLMRNFQNNYYLYDTYRHYHGYNGHCLRKTVPTNCCPTSWCYRYIRCTAH